MVATVGQFWWEGRAILHLAEKSMLSVSVTIPGPNPVLALDLRRGLKSKWVVGFAS